MAQRSISDDFLSAPEVEAPATASRPSVTADDFASAPEYVEKETRPLFHKDGMMATAGDVSASAASGAADAVPAVAGIPGTVMRTGEWLGDRARTGFTNLTGSDPAAVGDSVRDALGNPSFLGPKRAISKAGKSDKQVADAVRGQAGKRDELWSMGDAVKAAHDAGMPSYEPQSGLGAAAHTAGNIGAGLLIAPGSVATKVLGTIEGTVGTKTGEWLGEKAGDYARDNNIGSTFGVSSDDIKNGLTMAGGAAGLGNAARVGQKHIAAEPRSANQFEAARIADEKHFTANPSERPAMTMEQAAQQGVHPLAVAGPNVRQLAAESATTPEAMARIDTYNQLVDQPHAMADQALGGVQTAGEAYLARQDALRATNKANYERTMALPHAQNVWSPQLETMLNSRGMSGYVNEATRLAQLEGNSGIIPPRWREPQPARQVLDIPTQQLHTVDAVPGGWYAHPEAPPNLAFWDYVKKAMDDDIDHGTAKLNNRDSNAVRATRDLKSDMTGHVDAAVPEYAQTRGVAADLFGDRDAVQQGANYLKNIDTFKLAEANRAFDGMPQDHQAGFATGFAAELRRKMENDPPATTSRLINKPEFQQKMRRVLGDQAADAITAATNAKKISGGPPTQSGYDFAKHILASSTPIGIVQGASALVHGVPSFALHPITAPVGAYQIAKRVALSRVNKAQQAGADAHTIRKLTAPGAGLIPRREPAAPMTSGVNSSSPLGTAPPLTIRRKAGGEVGMKAGAKINVDAAAAQLVKAVEQTRVMLSGQTQNLLSQPDTHVVQALSAAKNALG